jgi:hypothetical protein
MVAPPHEGKRHRFNFRFSGLSSLQDPQQGADPTADRLVPREIVNSTMTIYCRFRGFHEQ